MRLFKKSSLGLTSAQKHRLSEPMDQPGERRVIKTARTVEEINEAARSGLHPLIKPVKPRKDIHFQVAVFQDPETGEIETSGDFRLEHWGAYPGKLKVLGYQLYYPYCFPEPFAAYLIPANLVVGECVWLEDLIEDIVAVWGNQGYHPRLAAAPAVWDGTDFEVLFDEVRHADHWIG